MRAKNVLKKGLIPLAAVAVLGLGGCVAYPAYDAGYGYAPPPPVVVQPAVSFGYYGGYRGGHRHYHGGHRHWR